MSTYLLSEEMCPSLSSDILDKLSESKVHSVIDLISSSLSKIKTISRNKKIDFQKLLEIRNHLYSKYGPKTPNNKLNAFYLIPKTIGYKTGIKRFDEMIVNGIRTGDLIEMKGCPESGKTQFCYTFAVKFVNKYKKKVLFIDCDGSFSRQRVETIALNNVMNKNFVLENIKVLRITNIFSLLDKIESISYDIQTNPESEYKEIAIIFIDSLSTPLTVEFKKQTFEAKRIERERLDVEKAKLKRNRFICCVTHLANVLSLFASKHSMAVIVVNTQSLVLKSNWNNSVKLCLNFSNVTSIERNQSKPYYLKAIKVTRSYNKDIIDNSYERFLIQIQGFIDFVDSHFNRK